VAVVIGAAFGAVVRILVDNLITPLIAAIVGQPYFFGLARRASRSPSTAASSSTACSSTRS